MKIYLDTEFNSFNGELISMGLAAEDGSEFYQVLDYTQMILDPWVEKHVIPILYKKPIDPITFKNKLKLYLNQYKEVTIIADWPEDIKHFCEMLITGPGSRINTPKLTFDLDYNLPDTSTYSLVPHNALEDAKALMRGIEN